MANEPTIYGLIGHPLGHSFSRRYFTEKFDAGGIDAVYKNFDISSIDQLKDIVEQTPHLRGLNVTSPYKLEVIPLLDTLDPLASEIGSVNVVAVSRQNGRAVLKGYNSDVAGFVKAISRVLPDNFIRNALVLGSGGASRAAVAGLSRLGVPSRIVSRNPREGQLSYSQLDDALMAEVGIIVNATPLGMAPHTDECPPIPYGLIRPVMLAFDMIYNPAETLFMRRAKAAGAIVANGLQMLVGQAERSWEIWHQTE